MRLSVVGVGCLYTLAALVDIFFTATMIRSPNQEQNPIVRGLMGVFGMAGGIVVFIGIFLCIFWLMVAISQGKVQMNRRLGIFFLGLVAIDYIVVHTGIAWFFILVWLAIVVLAPAGMKKASEWPLIVFALWLAPLHVLAALTWVF